MAMQTDVKAKSLEGTGIVYEGRARVKGIVITPGASAGNVTLTDGGTSKMKITTVAGGETFNALIPGEGVLFTTNVAATLVAASVTVFYG